MSLKDPEARKAYNRAYRLKRLAEDPEYQEKLKQQHATYHARKQATDAKYRAKRAAAKKRWYEEYGGREKERIRCGRRSWEDYIADLEKTRQTHTAYMRKWSQSPSGQRSRVKRAMKRRGFTIEQYDAAYDLQEGNCRVCGVHRERYTKDRLVVDHCHKSGQFRALLCGKCNAAIGMLGEDEQILKNAIEYLNSVRSSSNKD